MSLILISINLSTISLLLAPSVLPDNGFSALVGRYNASCG